MAPGSRKEFQNQITRHSSLRFSRHRQALLASPALLLLSVQRLLLIIRSDLRCRSSFTLSLQSNTPPEIRTKNLKELLFNVSAADSFHSLVLYIPTPAFVEAASYPRESED